MSADARNALNLFEQLVDVKSSSTSAETLALWVIAQALVEILDALEHQAGIVGWRDAP